MFHLENSLHTRESDILSYTCRRAPGKFSTLMFYNCLSACLPYANNRAKHSASQAELLADFMSWLYCLVQVIKYWEYKKISSFILIATKINFVVISVFLVENGLFSRYIYIFPSTFLIFMVNLIYFAFVFIKRIKANP